MYYSGKVQFSAFQVADHSNAILVPKIQINWTNINQEITLNVGQLALLGVKGLTKFCCVLSDSVFPSL